MPLAWAHAEYIQLVRSAADGQVFGLISEVADRYRNRRKAPPLEIWKFNRQVRSVRAGEILRIQAASPFRLHWTSTNGNRSMTRTLRPLGPAMSMWTFTSYRSRAVRSVSRFFGRLMPAGKGETFKSTSTQSLDVKIRFSYEANLRYTFQMVVLVRQCFP